MLQIPSEPLQEDLQHLFAAPDGVNRLIALFQNFASSPQTLGFFAWFLDFCTEQLQTCLWADREVVVSLLASGLHDEGLDVVEYLCRATYTQPELAEDKCVFELALAVDISSVNAFSEHFLARDESRRALIQACRGTKLQGENKWGGRSWPLDTFPCGFLKSLPSTYCEKEFLLEAACHVDDAGVSFKELPEALRADRDVTLAFVESQVGILGCLPTSLLQDREVLRKGLKEEPRAIEVLPQELWQDEELVEIAALGWGATFFVSDIGKLHSHRRDLVLKLASKDFNTLFFTPRYYGHVAEVVEAALTSEYARWAGVRGRKEARHASQLIQMMWNDVVADVLKLDTTFLKKLLSSNGTLLGLCKKHQRGDPTLVFAAVSNDAAALKDVDESFWRSHKRRRINATDGARCNDTTDTDDMARKLLSANLECWLYLPPEVKQRLKLDKFECCVCYQLPGKEIRQCLEGGHLICQSCVDQILKEAVYAIPRCPVCRCYVWTDDNIFSYGARNRFAEKALQEQLRELE